MDFMDLLLAEAIAAGMARQAAEARQRPPPDNFFILPPDPQVNSLVFNIGGLWKEQWCLCYSEFSTFSLGMEEALHCL